MSVAGGRGRARDSWFDPARRVDVENVSVIEIGEARLLAFVEVASENDERGTCEGG